MSISSLPKKTAPLPDAKVYSVPAYQSFMDSIARGVMDENTADPLKTADTVILVPDRGAAAALRQAFITQAEGAPQIMPAIEVAGDLDEAQLRIQLRDYPDLLKRLENLLPPVSRMERKLMLANEILKIPGISSSPQKALQLGEELGHFFDEVQRYNVNLGSIDKLVPAKFKGEWAQTSAFLKIITDIWPQKLAELKKSDPGTHESALLQIQADYWRAAMPDHSVLAAGFDSSTPATRSLLQAVTTLPHGKIVLPGFDSSLDADSWNALTPVHPQYAFKEILEGLDVARSAVQTWQAQPLSGANYARAHNLGRTNDERQKLLRESMLPAATATDATSPAKETIDVQALSGMDLITASTPQEEASVIALKMRESLEVQGRTATLVTEDRGLARRVSARLRSWNIDVQDEAGVELSETPVGVYLLATATMAAEKWAPVPTLEALRHPLSTLGEEDHDTFNRKVSELENLVYHGPRPAPGAKGLKNALTAAFNRAAKFPPAHTTPEQLKERRTEMTAMVAALETAGRSFFAKMAADTPVPFRTLLDEHIRFAEALAADKNAPGASKLWAGEDGIKAAQHLSALRDVANLAPAVTGPEYVDVLDHLLRDIKVHDKKTSHPELRIMTPEQARFLKSDTVIVGGLSDKVWPPAVDENPWFSPKMLAALGLPAPENRIGHAARRFVQMVSNPNVLLTHSLRSGDAPAIASPFLARMLMVLRSMGLDQALEKKTRLLDIHTAMYTPAKVTPIEPPHPTPPVAYRPKQLPVTGVETLMRDPYSTYVKYVLQIKQKAPIDSSPSVNERGTFTHEALDIFMKRHPDEIPENAVDELLAIGRETFKERIDNPSVRAFWWPRFEQIAKWFVGFEIERRKMSETLGTEVHGKLEFDTGDGIFTLTAIADRIDRDEKDQLMMIDYKTGGVPEQKAVKLGLSPQLTLEALISFTGGFEGIDAADVGKLQYWKLSGGRPAAYITDVKGDVKQLVSEARDGIEALVKAFNDKSTPYLVTPRPEWAPRYNNVRHLSRVDEWSTVKKSTGKSPSSSKRRPKS